MASVQTKAVRCPRCSQLPGPLDDWFDSCGYCQWPLSEAGIECVQCRLLNLDDATVCKNCGGTL